jgi:preprotein translocase subunit SecE
MATAALQDKSPEPKGSLLRTYKSGQGFWTRLGTGIGAGLIILFTVQWLYRRIPTWTALSTSDWPLFAVIAGITIGLIAITWWLINRPRHADFLINTDGEMKKVTWPTRRELIGSTKVVVIFMFFMGTVLFLYDQIFGLFFYSINVLKILPPLLEPIFGPNGG